MRMTPMRRKTLPAWGALLLGALMAVSLARRNAPG